MSDLLSLLHLGSAALSAQHGGASVAANNAANVNTLGYSRQRVDLRAELAAPEVGGVRSLSPTRVADELLARRGRGAQAALGYSRTLAPALADLEARLARSGPPIEDTLSALFAGLQRVAAMPTDSMMRASAVDAARGVAAALRGRAGETQAARTDADARIRDGAKAATALTGEIAALNKAIRMSSDPVLRDRREVAASKLADLMGGSGRIDPDGQLRWVLPDGAVLVDGDRAATVATSTDASTGFRRVEIVDGAARRDVTVTLSGGSLAAELELRDVDGAAAAARLDQFAFDLSSTMNSIHAANAGLDGATGRNLFGPAATVTGAAAAIDVDPAIAADPRLLAAGAPGSGAGDNRGALALIALRDQAIASGGTQTLGDAAIALLGDVGTRAAEAGDAAERDTVIDEHLAGLRDSLSGVDLQEELAKLVHFQHASEAMTRFLSTIDGMLEDLLGRL